MTDTITVRRMKFAFPDDMELVFIRDDPQMSLNFLGAWMTLPYLEPYLIRSVRAAAAQIDDPRLREDIDLFCSQEGIHYREHAKANRVIRSSHPQFQVLQQLEDELKEQYDRFTSTKSLAWNLAYAEAFESITTASAITQFEMRMFDGMTAPLGDLFAWHIMEELEHRTVAFEVLEAVRPGYLYRVVVGTRCLLHYLAWTSRLYKAMKKAAPEIVNQPIGREEKKRRDRIRRDFLRKTFPRWLAVYKPGYHPRNVELPPNFFEIQKKYDDAVAA